MAAMKTNDGRLFERIPKDMHPPETWRLHVAARLYIANARTVRGPDRASGVELTVLRLPVGGDANLGFAYFPCWRRENGTVVRIIRKGLNARVSRRDAEEELIRYAEAQGWEWWWVEYAETTSATDGHR